MRAVVVRERAAMAVLVLLLLLPVLGTALYLWNKHQWATGRLAEVEPRYARLLGLEASQAELAQAQRAAQAHLARFAYPASQDVSQTGADAQQRVRNVATVAGLTLVSSQVMPAKAEGAFDRIPMTVQLEGDMGALQAVLVVLASEKPAVHFESMSLQTIGAVRPEVPARLQIQFKLFVLRKRS
jgi:general secretion pathway protein M